MRRTRRLICCRNCTLRLHNRPFRTRRGGHQSHQQPLHHTQIVTTFFTFNRHSNSTEMAQTHTSPAHQAERPSMVRQTTTVVEITTDLRQMPSQDEYRSSAARHQLSAFRTYYPEAHTSHIAIPSLTPSSGEHLPDSNPIN